MLEIVERKSTRFIALGLAVFPGAWLVLVIAQSTYFGPMRSVFTKVTRRYIDDLPAGWALFDLLFYLLPALGFLLIAIGLHHQDDPKWSRLFIAGTAVVAVVLITRQWSPGYL